MPTLRGLPFEPMSLLSAISKRKSEGVDGSLSEFWRDLPRLVRSDALLVEEHVRSGRFQRGLSLVAGFSSVLAGLEVTYEHYRGSYGQKVMWTPLALSAAMAGAGVWGALSPWAARTVLRWVSAVTIIDGLVGFGYHVRGIARKPGGWRLPVANLIMGPPIFAPPLFAVTAYLGLIASFLRPEETPGFRLSPARLRELVALLQGRRPHPWRTEVPLGRHQKHLAIATILATFFSGFEALYSHYKNNFRYAAQWTPILLTPALMGAAGASMKSAKVARTWLPAIALLAMADGGVGFFYHARGALRRPGGIKKPLYNIMYGPPIFAPLLFAACGFLGLLASLMRRERK
jgi:hypothetical protein